MDLGWFHCRQVRQAVKQTVDLLVIGDSCDLGVVKKLSLSNFVIKDAADTLVNTGSGKARGDYFTLYPQDKNSPKIWIKLHHV